MIASFLALNVTQPSVAPAVSQRTLNAACKNLTPACDTIVLLCHRPPSQISFCHRRCHSARSVTGLAISSEMHQPTEKCFSTVGNVWSLHRPVHANSSTFS
jgi:hypothetical protein